MNYDIETKMMTVKFKGVDALFPRINGIVLTDMALEFKHLQFEVRLAIGTTIKKLHVQSLEVHRQNLSIHTLYII